MDRAYIAPSFLGIAPEKEDWFFEQITKYGAALAHADVVDADFVKRQVVNTDMAEFCRLVLKVKSLPLDIHLMVDDPGPWLDLIDDQIMSQVKAQPFISLHREARCFKTAWFHKIKEINARPGIAIKPSTPLAEIKEYLPLVELVIVMTVNPGLSGQKMIKPCLDKVKVLYGMRKQYRFLIEVDGGVNEQTAQEAVRSGASILVSGGFVQDDPRKIEVLSSFKRASI